MVTIHQLRHDCNNARKTSLYATMSSMRHKAAINGLHKIAEQISFQALSYLYTPMPSLH